MTRTIARAAGALALGAAAVVLAASPAEAAAYRYWTYWQAPAGATAWTFATQGPGTSVPADGDVEGWSFGVTTESGDPGDAPGTTPDFAAVCTGTPAEGGSKRVAVIIDTGSPALAPEGQSAPASITACVVAAEDSTGYEILRSVTQVRVENGLVCGIGGYPEGECAPVLDDAEAQSLLAAATAPPSPSATPVLTAMDDQPEAAAGGSATPLATLAVGILLVGGAAFWYARGRRGR